MKGKNRIKWQESHDKLKAIFDKVINEFGSPDVNFRAGSRIFKVHKKVLEKHSSVLKAKLSDVWQTSGNVLQLDEEYVEPEVVEELLTWIYYTNAGKNRKCSTENAHSLCIAADYLLISNLVTSCCSKLCGNVTQENFYDLFTLSNQFSHMGLQGACVNFIVRTPTSSLPDVFKSIIKDPKMFIDELLKLENTPSVRKLIMLSLPIWTEASFQERFQDLENLLRLVPPEAISSDTLFRFMKTELYSKLDKSVQRQYSVRSYLPEDSSSTDKLYCIGQINGKAYRILNHLDLSANPNWSNHRPELSIARKGKFMSRILVVASGEKIYFLRDTLSKDKTHRCRMDITVFCTETGEDRSISTVENTLLDDHNRQMFAGAVLDDYIYVTYNKSVNRFCLKTHQWETCKEMQTVRFKHRLVALDGQLYALGGEPRDLDPRPERYNPRVDQWEYITPSNYRHRPPTAVTHERQIYVLSKAGFEVYSPETDRWTQFLVPDAYRMPSLISIAGRLWLMKGAAHSRKIQQVHEFDVIKQKWTRLPDMPEGKYKDFALVIQHTDNKNTKNSNN